MAYLLGQIVRITATFKTTSTSAVVDPSSIVFHILPLGGTKVTYTYGVDAAVVRSSTGIYYVDYTPATATSYTYDVIGTGTGAAAEEGSFSVQARTIT